MKAVIINYTTQAASPDFAKMGVKLIDAGGKEFNLAPLTADKLKQGSVEQADGSYDYILPSLEMSVGQGSCQLTPLNASDSPIGSTVSKPFDVSLQEGTFQPAIVGVR